MNATSRLPTLTGSPKQVEWATTIRESMVRPMSTVATRAIAALYRNGHPELGEAVDLASGKILARTEASWWIERRPKHQPSVAAEARILDELMDAGVDEAACDLVRDAMDS